MAERSLAPNAHLFVCICALAFFLISRPHVGVFHDAMLYSMQAAHVLDGQRLADDLFFFGGSQTNLSLFPRVHALALREFGLEVTTWSGFLLVRVAYFLVVVWFVWTWLPPALRIPGLLGVFAVGSVYGPGANFGFAESAFTARPVGEIFTIAAITLWGRQRRKLAAMVAIVGATMHPIMGGVGVIILSMLFAAEPDGPLARVRAGGWQLKLLAGGIICIGLVVTIIAPRMDADWVTALGDVNVFAFLTHWNLADYLNLLRQLFVAAIAGRVLRDEVPGLVSLLTCVVVATVAADCAHLVFADLLKVALPTALQLWRTQVVLAFLVAVLIAPVIFRLVTRDSLSQLTGLLLLTSYFFSAFGAAQLLMTLGTWLLILPATRDAVAPIKWFPLTGRALAIVLAVAGSANAVAMTIELEPYSRVLSTHWFVQIPAFTVLAVAVAVQIGICPEALLRLPVRATAVVFLAVAISLVDLRSPLSRLYERDHDQPSKLLPRVVTHNPGLVYWLGPAELSTWFLLGQPGYDAHWQRLSAIFSRPNAMEVRRRKGVIEPLQSPISVCVFVSGFMGGNGDDCTVTDTDVAKVCRAEHRLQQIIVGYRPEGKYDSSFFLPDEHRTDKLHQYWTFDCNRLRMGAE